MTIRFWCPLGSTQRLCMRELLAYVLAGKPVVSRCRCSIAALALLPWMRQRGGVYPPRGFVRLLYATLDCWYFIVLLYVVYLQLCT